MLSGDMLAHIWLLKFKYGNMSLGFKSLQRFHTRTGPSSDPADPLPLGPVVPSELVYANWENKQSLKRDPLVQTSG